ncbi:GIY-YIG nuclease family protein [Xanthomonas phage NEB7]|nr:GIY-YIG nuclease family protein [Xanthomonas phage NEB7]
MRYIGQAKRVLTRWGQHRYSLRHHSHANLALQAAFDKYGLEGLRFEVLECCAPEELDTLERAALAAYSWSQLYNMRLVAPQPERLRRKLLPAHIEAIRAANTGRIKSADELRRMSAAAKGRPVSSATRSKIAGTLTGRIVPDAVRAQISATTGSSGQLGVHWNCRLSKWLASITHQGKSLSLGAFETIEQAAAARHNCLRHIEAKPAMSRLDVIAGYRRSKRLPARK